MDQRTDATNCIIFLLNNQMLYNKSLPSDWMFYEEVQMTHVTLWKMDQCLRLSKMSNLTSCVSHWIPAELMCFEKQSLLHVTGITDWILTWQHCFDLVNNPFDLWTCFLWSLLLPGNHEISQEIHEISKTANIAIPPDIPYIRKFVSLQGCSGRAWSDHLFRFHHFINYKRTGLIRGQTRLL